MDTTDLIRTIRRIVYDAIDDIKIDTSTKFATVETVTANGATVTFDGEGAPTVKLYKYLANSGITVGDRVVMHKAGHSWVILGAID